MHEKSGDGWGIAWLLGFTNFLRAPSTLRRETLKARLRKIERFVVDDDDLPQAIIFSVISARAGVPPRDDERECIGLLSTYGGPWKKIVRQPGESLDEMDRRAEIGVGGSIPTWLRVYGSDEKLERMEVFTSAEEIN